MSFAVVRGAATAAQRYLDGVLAAAAAGGDARRVSLPQLLLHCMREQPDRVFMTNGASGARTTSRQLMALAVPLARALAARGLTRSDPVMMMVRGHERTVAVYLALNFAGLVPFMTDPASTDFEVQYYLDLIEPSIIFCDAATEGAVRTAVGARAKPIVIMPIHTNEILEYAKGYEDNIDDFRVAPWEPKETLLLLATSGSTGIPKAAEYCSRGMIDQLPISWTHFTQFPTPTERMMFLATPQWGTFFMMVTTGCVYHVELLMTPALPTVDHVLHIMETYKPTWAFFGPPFLRQMVPAASPRHFASLQTVISLGSQATPDLLAALKAKIPASSHLGEAYGSTELHGYATVPGPDTPLGSVGKFVNIWHYKLLKDDGEQAAVDEEGELFIKGDSLITGYFKNESETEELMPEGWYRTGDTLAQDAAGNLFYKRRIKFTFKYNNLHVSPEELENVICQLSFVAECVVCDSPAGPAAGVVLRNQAPPEGDARRQIIDLVSTTLSDHKRLRGGVAFVAQQLPRTHSGKIQRGQARDLLLRLQREGLCC